jgi:hypothetical protein
MIDYLSGGDKKGKGLKGFFGALANTPNAPMPSMGGGGDARSSGDSLLKYLMNPTIADLMKKKRLG